MKKQTNYILTSSFTVDKAQADNNGKLSLCEILQAITQLNDQMVLRIYGELDFDKLHIKHYSLDMIDAAHLNETVTLYAYAQKQPGDEWAIHLSAKKAGGSLVFTGQFLYHMLPVAKLV